MRSLRAWRYSWCRWAADCSCSCWRWYTWFCNEPIRQFTYRSMMRQHINKKLVGSRFAYRYTSVPISTAKSFMYSIVSSALCLLASSSLAFFLSSSFLASSSFRAFLRYRSATFYMCRELSTMRERPFLPPRRSIFAGSFFSLKGNFFFVLSTYI